MTKKKKRAPHRITGRQRKERVPKRRHARKKAAPAKKKSRSVFLSSAKPKVPRAGRPAQSENSAEEKEVVHSEATLDKTPMKIYLQQIEKIPLLTPQEEVGFSKKIAGGGTEAKKYRERMIRSNLRLVISIAKRYANLGLPFSDLVEEGNIGLMRAVDKFNYRKGYRFSTYASWWIKQAIMRALSNQSKTIRVPVYMYDVISKWRKIRDALIQKLSRMPTIEEVAEAMDISIEKVKEVERIGSQPGSLNAPVSLEGGSEMIDVIEDEASASPAENIEDLFQGERVDQLLARLDGRERQILILRFGLRGGTPHTLEQTAHHFNVTRERIRQIEIEAIQKIRDAIKAKAGRMEDYVR